MLEAENGTLSVTSATNPHGDSSLKVEELLVVSKCAAECPMQDGCSQPQGYHCYTKRQGANAQMRT